MRPDPRHIAFAVLVAWDRSDTTLDKVLDAHTSELSSLSKQDRSLCNAIIFGVLRNRAALDWIIRAFSKSPFDKISKKVLYLLRISLYQILYMDRIPAYAAINASVETAKKLLGKPSAGFINALLRNASKNHETIAFPDSEKDPAGYISVTCSMPDWLARKWIQDFGVEETGLLCREINTIPDITVRANLLKTTRQDLSGRLAPHVDHIEPAKYAPQGLSFRHPRVPICDLAPFAEGLFQVQDEAAQMVSHLLDPRPHETILDACAGLGGKTSHIAELMNNTGTVTALEIDPKKLDALKINSDRLGIDNVRTMSKDLLKVTIKDFDAFFDRVLLDAPCTGLGVLRRNPDTRWKRKKNDIQRLSAQQKRMLNAAANLVRPGGILVYAVCSCEKEENEAVIRHFLQKRIDFSIDKLPESDRYSRWVTRDGFLKTYPAPDNMDGFFTARLIRKTRVL